jgi:hypothetical protein
MSSYGNNIPDEITIDDDKRDVNAVHEEGLTQTKSWEQIKSEAERDEEWQHSLGLLQSLKINRAVSGLLPELPLRLFILTCQGGPVVSRRFELYHHGIIRYSSSRILVWFTGI